MVHVALRRRYAAACTHSSLDLCGNDLRKRFPGFVHALLPLFVIFVLPSREQRTKEKKRELSSKQLEFYWGKWFERIVVWYLKVIKRRKFSKSKRWLNKKRNIFTFANREYAVIGITVHVHRGRGRKTFVTNFCLLRSLSLPLFHSILCRNSSWKPRERIRVVTIVSVRAMKCFGRGYGKRIDESPVNWFLHISGRSIDNPGVPGLATATLTEKRTAKVDRRGERKG